MRFLYTLSICLLIASGLFAETIVITDNDLQDGEYSWTNNNEYILDGIVVLNSGGILNIEAGTVIRGKLMSSDNSTSSILVIARGAQIFAEGTSDAPIIFTTETDDLENPDDISFNDKGLWGGIHILGAARIATETPTIIAEQLSTYADQSQVEFGGTDDNDNSGTLIHVSIRHAGGMANTFGEEFNGLTLSGVGDGTSIDYIEVYASGDDGIAIEGGTVNLKHLSVTFSADDSFDWDLGWRGKGQFWLGVQAPDGDRCGEHSGTGSTNSDIVSRPIISNVTFIGPGMDATDGANEALSFNRGTGGIYMNSVFTNFPNYAIRVEDQVDQVDAYDNLQDGTLLFNCNYWWNFGNGSTWDELINVLDTYENQDAALLLQVLENFNNQIADPELTDISSDPNLFDPRPIPGSEALTAACQIDDNFFEQVDYVGAFGSDIWLAQWSGMAANRFFAGEVTNTIDVVSTDFEVYPNPTKGNLTIEAGQAANYRLMDLSGRLLLEQRSQMEVFELDLSDLPPAMYLLQIQTNNQLITKKVFVE